MLCGCNSDSNDNENEIRIVSQFTNLCNNGELYSDSGKAVFFDFISMVSSPLCARPNCTHTDAEVCSAYNMGICPFIYNDKIYYFMHDIFVDKDGTFREKSDIYVADLDGTNRQAVKTIYDMRLADISPMCIIGNELYVSAISHTFSEYGGYGDEQACEAYLCKYNFDTNTFTSIKSFGMNYSVGLYFYGVYNNCIYMTHSYKTESTVFTFETTTSNSQDTFIRENIKFDLETFEISQSDLSEIHAITNGWCIMGDENETVFLNEDGRQIISEESVYDFIYIVNDIAFVEYYGYCIDLSDGKKYAVVKPENPDQRYTVKDYIGEKYIVAITDYEKGSKNYAAFTKNELIKEEIK